MELPVYPSQFWASAEVLKQKKNSNLAFCYLLIYHLQYLFSKPLPNMNPVSRTVPWCLQEATKLTWTQPSSECAGGSTSCWPLETFPEHLNLISPTPYQLELCYSAVVQDCKDSFHFMFAIMVTSATRS